MCILLLGHTYSSSMLEFLMLVSIGYFCNIVSDGVYKIQVDQLSRSS